MRRFCWVFAKNVRFWALCSGTGCHRGTWARLKIPVFSRACIVKWRVTGNNWRMPENSNYRIFPGASRRRCRECPIIPISNRSAVRPENGGRPAAETSIIPKAQNRANHCKIAHFRIFSCIFGPAENRAENARICGGFDGFSRKMCGFGRYAAVPNAIWEHGRD